MQYDDIFAAFYSQYRAEASIPPASDDEYVIGMRLANEAINRWANYDNTMWQELFTTRVASDDGDGIVTTATEYACPSDMQLAGGIVKITNTTTGAVLARYPIISVEQAQFRNDNASYAYFFGNPGKDGFTLVLNPAPVAPLIGGTIDYVYYKKPTLFTTGSDISEMSEPYFIVHRMLANRFRSSRNPYYTSAKQDAEDVLSTMQLANNSGSWANPWKLQDNSGSIFGA